MHPAQLSPFISNKSREEVAAAVKFYQRVLLRQCKTERENFQSQNHPSKQSTASAAAAATQSPPNWWSRLVKQSTTTNAATPSPFPIVSNKSKKRNMSKSSVTSKFAQLFFSYK